MTKFDKNKEIIDQNEITALPGNLWVTSLNPIIIQTKLYNLYHFLFIIIYYKKIMSYA